MKDIIDNKEQIWNERFKKRMQKMDLTQRDFISIYKAKYQKGSQADVSKWMHVGEVDGRTGKRRGFPAFETMRNIADVLEVSVGYLIGETDYETFELERCSNYLGLSPKSVTAIRNITSGKAIPPFYKYPDEQRTAALEKLVECPLFVDYLKGFCDLAEAICTEQNHQKYFEAAIEKIPKEYREEAVSLWSDPEQAIEEGINPTDKLWAYANLLDDSANNDMRQHDIAVREIKALRYALQETQTKIIDALMDPERLICLLPT